MFEVHKTGGHAGNALVVVCEAEYPVRKVGVG